MIDLPFDFNTERTEFADSFYAVIGRLLAFATRFESHCQALAIVMKLESALHDGIISFDNDGDLELLVKKMTQRKLYDNIKNIIVGFGLPNDISLAMDNARKARNEVAHSLTLGIEDRVEDDEKRAIILQQIRDLVFDIAEGDRLVCTFLHLETNEHLPTLAYIQNYSDMIVNWVCEI